MQRKIIHMDMDAYYASVEQRDHPELRGKPIAVGGGEKRGVTTTASYEARAYGVRSAMPGYLAKQKCPDLIFVRPRFDVYRSVSQQIREIFRRYTDIIEPLSLDEAYLDVTECKKDIPYATDIARDIQRSIKEELELTCSAGVSYCKFISKIASDIKKPYGITVIKPHQAEAFLAQLPIEKFYGVGKVTAEKMHKLGIHTGAELREKDRAFLIHHFGKSGSFYFDIVRGIDDRPVRTERKRKSLGVERTLMENVSSYEDMLAALLQVLPKLHERLTKAKYNGRTLTLKVKTADFQIYSRSKSISSGSYTSPDVIEKAAMGLLREHFESFGAIRLIGLTVSNEIEPEQDTPQLTLWT